MSAQIVVFPAHRSRAVCVLLTKRELAVRWRVSVRWIEERQRHDGLPVQKDAHSRLVRYDLAEVEAWRARRLSA
jgi:predicted DNA-binding transcriptional regulator AlpA